MISIKWFTLTMIIKLVDIQTNIFLLVLTTFVYKMVIKLFTCTMSYYKVDIKDDSFLKFAKRKWVIVS